MILCGSITDSGFYWVNPFYSKRKVTLRVRNFETGAITTPERKDAAGTIVLAAGIALHIGFAWPHLPGLRKIWIPALGAAAPTVVELQVVIRMASRVPRTRAPSVVADCLAAPLISAGR